MTYILNSGTGHKFLKIIAVILGGLLCLFLIATILLLTVLEPYAARYIKKQVTESTAGLYQLEFEDLEIDLFTTTLTLRQLHLYPDTSLYRQQKVAGTAHAMLFELEADQFKIVRLDLMDALFEQHLNLESLLLEKPELILYKDQEETTPKEKSNTSDPALKSLYIGELNITDASFRSLSFPDGQALNHTLPHFSVSIQQLQADSLAQQDPSQMFQAEDLQLRAENYAYQTPDSVYSLQFGLLSYSSRNKDLLLENAVIIPDTAANRALGQDSAYATLYQLDAPALQMTGLDLAAAHQSKRLLLDNISLQDYSLKILEQLKHESGDSTATAAQFYTNMAAYLQEIQVKEFDLSNAQLAYYSKSYKSAPLHAVNKINVNLQGVRLDSSTIFSPKDHLPVQEILLAAEGYAYQDALSSVTARVEKADFSTRDKTLHAANISIRSDWQKNEQLPQSGHAQAELYSLELPALSIKGVDMLQAMESSQLSVESITLQNPTLGLQMASGVQKEAVSPGHQNTLAPVWTVLDTIEVDSIRVQNASFIQYTGPVGTKPVQNLQDASLLILNLQLDAGLMQQESLELPIEELSLTARNYQYTEPGNGPAFSLGSLRYSTSSQALTARTIKLNSNPGANNLLEQSSNARHYDIAARELNVAGLDMIKAINTRRLDVGAVVLQHPSVEMVQNRDLAPDTNAAHKKSNNKSLFGGLIAISATSILLDEGSFTFHEKQHGVIRSQLLEEVSVKVSELFLTARHLENPEGALPVQELTLTAKDYTYHSPDSIYTITLDNMHYSSRAQQLTAALFEVATDKEAHEKLKASNPERASRNLFDITARNFSISGFDLIRAYETGQFHMAEMVLTEPEVKILQDQEVPEQPQEEEEQKGTENKQSAESLPEDETRDSTDLSSLSESDTSKNNSAASDEALALEQVAQLVESFRVEKVRVERGRFQFNILEDSVQSSQDLEQVWIELQQLRLVSLEAVDPLQMFAVSDMDVLIRDYTYYTPDSLYVFAIQEISSTMARQSLQIDSLSLKPLHNKEEFQEQVTYAIDRYDLLIPSIRLQNIDLGALFNRQQLIASQMLLEQAKADIYRDNRLKQDEGRRPPTLQGMIREAGVYIRLDSLHLLKAQLYYTEVSPGGNKPGLLALEDMTIGFANVTNDAAIIRRNNLATARGQALLMGDSKLVVDFVFHLDHSEDLYTYEGSLKPMSMSSFNPLLNNLVFADVRSGSIEQVNFSVIANRHRATGQMRFLYQDLKLALISKEGPAERGFKHKAGTWVLNNLLVKSNNPSRLGRVRGGEIEVDRIYEKSVFNHMAKAMVSGIVSTLLPNLVERIADKFTNIP